MRILEELQVQFQGYVWKHVLSMLLGLMLLKGPKTLSALLCQESLPTLSRTLNHYPWPLEQFGLGHCRCRGAHSLSLPDKVPTS